MKFDPFQTKITPAEVSDFLTPAEKSEKIKKLTQYF
jgi:hypothetical protein